MRRILFIVAVIYTLTVLADGVSTILMMNVETPSNIEVVETHPLGYPNCLITIVLYPTPFLITGLICVKMKSKPYLVLSLTTLLVLILAMLIMRTVAAVANNIEIINTFV